MTRHEHQQEPEELDLEPETVDDLEPSPADGDDVRGGAGDSLMCTFTCLVCTIKAK